jgi:hypothetical protein
MPEVKSINKQDEKNIIKDLKSRGLVEAVNYICALKNIIEIQNEIIKLSKAKINQLLNNKEMEK